MGNKKHIDRLFQEKFKDFEAKPSDAVWQNIQKQLNQPAKTTKTIVPLWSKWAAMAAIFLVFISVGITVFTNDGASNTSITTTDANLEESTNKNERINLNTSSSTEHNKTDLTISEGVTTTSTDSASDSRVKNTVNVQSNEQQLNSSTTITQTDGTNLEKTAAITDIKNNAISNAASDKEKIKKQNTVLVSTTSQSDSNSQTRYPSTEKNNSNTITKNTSVKKNTPYTNPYKNNTLSVKTNEALFNVKGKLNAVANTNLAKKRTINDSPIIDSALGESIEDAIDKLKKLDEKEKEPPLNKWSVNANVAPVYYNSLGKGSSIDQQFVDNSKNGEVNMSYGVQVGYAFNDNLKLRSGVSKLNLSYDTAGVVVYQSVSTGASDIKPFRNIDFETTQNGENLSVLSTESFNVQQINSVFNDNFNAALSQRMSYIEVPLELEYALIKKRFGLNIIGGMSTFFLSDNQVVTEFDNYRTKIGEANNINDISFSTNVGLGLDYNFSKTFTFNFEPTFKYKINTYSETSGNFKPYIIGVYTGLSYKF